MIRRTWLFLAVALLIMGAVGVFGGAASAALPGSMAMSAPPSGGTLQQVGSKQSAADPWGIENFDCSRINELRINEQMNLRAAAIMEHCSGQKTAQAGQKASNPVGSVFSQLRSPLAYGGPDKDTIVGESSNILQSESWVWSQGNTVVVTFNDFRGLNLSPRTLCGASTSTDGGATFTYLPVGVFSGLGNCSGDPFHYFSARANKWFAGFFSSACGANGIGQWESVDGINWTTSGCSHTGSSDDRFSGWVDNKVGSPFFGTQYVIFSNFALTNAPLQVVRSTDDGVTWSAAQTLSSRPGGGANRPVQLTGSLGTDGTVFAQSMDEGGGGLANRINYTHRTTDGGATWTQIQQGPAFPAPGSGTCPANSFFAIIPGPWRHQGWGQPGVGPNNVAHYAYAQHGAGADQGDIMYIRSTDNGSTWSSPIKLNTDATTRAQWMPSLSVNSQGSVFVGWYDRRNTTNNDYERFGRASTDNGVTWQADQAVSDIIIPQWAPDPNTAACYGGDYDYAMASDSGQGTDHFQTWNDGRVVQGGVNQMNVFFDKIPLVGGTPTPTVTGTPPTNTPTRTATITSTTTNTPVPSATPCAFTQVMNEGFEAGTLGAFTQTVIITSTTTPVPTPGWASVASNPHSGTRSAFAPDPDRTTDSRLATINNINIPAGVSTATLTFWHRFAFENLFDGGVLEVSTDGGTTWADADANIQQGGYNGTITVFQGCVTAGTPPPWPNGKRVWTSSQTTYGQVRVNLLPYQGTNMKFRFRLGTDCSVSNTGWNVDDVVVTYAGACSTVTGTPPTNTPISTATRTVTAGTAVVSPTVCAATPVNLVLDDGTVENSVGWTNSTMNFTAIWINRSSPPAASFPMNLTNISIKWPNSAALVGKTIALLVYHDADGDGDPSDAVKVAQVNGQTITVANGTTFQDFPVNVNIPTAGDVYYGFADTYNSGGVSPRTFPAPLDTTATQGRSWVAAQDGTEDPDFDNLGNNDNLGTIDALSGGALTGNWVIRASGTGGGGCVTGTPVATSVASSTPQVSPTVCVGSTQLVQDGSFEGGSPSSVWTEKSTNFGTPLCNAACGSGGGTAGPRTGDWWAWFGGTSDEEDGAVSQTVNIPAGGATLSFYLWLGAHSGGGTADYLRVLVGGTEVFRADDTSTAYDAGYTLVTVPVAATGSVILRFEEHNEAGTGVINFSVDDVSLTAGGNCPTVVATITAVASSTRTTTSTAVASATRTATIPVAATSTATTGVVATMTSVPPTSCPLEFSDVPPDSTFYTYIRCLVCRFIISGYNDNTFRPNNNITRGQIAKMVSNSAGINDNPGEQIYEDVNNTNPFYTWINRLSRRGYIGGYPCGTNIYEPCGAENMPYFRPGANATRGQLSKIVATAAQFNEPVSGQFFADVPDDNPFYVWIQRLATRNIMGGYACGSVPSEPCDDQNRPYFRWTNEVTRGQASKIVAGAFFPNCQTPGAADGKSSSPYARNPNGKQSDPLKLTSSQDARNGR